MIFAFIRDLWQRNALIDTFVFSNYAFLRCVASRDSLDVLMISLSVLRKK